MAAVGAIPQKWWALFDGDEPRQADLPCIAQHLRDRVAEARANFMEHLRRAHRLVWHALAWFALSIGAAVASAAITPQAVELICSASHGLKMVVKDDGRAPSSGHRMGDCPLCVTAGAPPPVGAFSVPSQPPAQAPTILVAAYVATFAATPPPARGPPPI
jgi:hypothetical protein